LPAAQEETGVSGLPSMSDIRNAPPYGPGLKGGRIGTI
jgi:hypothetical protein